MIVGVCGGRLPGGGWGDSEFLKFGGRGTSEYNQHCDNNNNINNNDNINYYYH